MKYQLLAVALSFIACAHAADGAKCRRVQTISCDSLPAELPFNVKPMQYEPGFKVCYLVESEDLIGFKDDSLSIDSIVGSDGKDVAKKRNGSPNYKQGSFPKTSDDGKYGLFEVEVSENKFGVVDSMVITGKIIALAGSDLETKKLTLPVNSEKSETAGDFTVSLAKEKSGMSFGGDEDSFDVRVTGDLTKLSSIKVMDGETVEKEHGWMGSGDSRTYHFDKPKNDAVTVEISYWKTLREVPILIEK